MSESALLWDKIQIHIYKIKHGKLRISFSNSDIRSFFSIIRITYFWKSSEQDDLGILKNST